MSLFFVITDIFSVSIEMGIQDVDEAKIQGGRPVKRDVRYQWCKTPAAEYDFSIISNVSVTPCNSVRTWWRVSWKRPSLFWWGKYLYTIGDIYVPNSVMLKGLSQMCSVSFHVILTAKLEAERWCQRQCAFACGVASREQYEATGNSTQSRLRRL